MHEKLSSASSLAVAANLRPIAVALGSNSGGIAKTHLAKNIASIAQADGKKVAIVEADPGNGSISKTLDGRRYTINHIPRTYEPQYAEQVIRESGGADVVIFDLGANALTHGKTSATLREGFDNLRAKGWHTQTIMLLPAGKDGLYEDAENFAGKMRQHGDIALAYVGRERGGDFRVLDSLKRDFPSFEIPMWEPALLAAVSDSLLLPIDFASVSEAGFGKATAWVAAHLHKIASQSFVKSLLGCATAIPVLDRLKTNAPAHAFTGYRQRWEISDIALAADEASICEHHALEKLATTGTDTMLAAQARSYIRALDARAKAHAEARARYSR